MVLKYSQKVKKKFLCMIRKLTKIDNLTIDNVKLNIRHSSISNDLRNFFYCETYEQQEIEILKKVLDKNDKVFEVGAGIGFLSTYCAKKIGSNQVVAYEANPKMIDKIKEIHSLNNVHPTIKNVILSDIDSEVNFYLENDFWSSSMIKRNNTSKKIKIKTINVNTELKKYKSNFLIIDIEGGEEKFIYLIDYKNINKILIELHPGIIGDESVSRIINFLIEQGFYLDLLKSEKKVCYFYK